LTATELTAALAQSIVAGVVGWTVGALVLSHVLARAERDPSELGLPERALAAAFGFVGFSVALMAAHVATGGLVFRVSWAVPAAGALVLAAGWRRRTWPRGVPWLRACAAVVVLAAIYATPVVIGGSSLRNGDTPWHMGRTSHLLGGELVPGGPAARFDRNAYPWGVHAVLASLVRLVPGSDTTAALTALGWLTLLATPLGAAVLARLVARAAGWPAAACAGLIGGFGWMRARTPVFYTSPDEAAFGADLVAASPNGTYALFPPALPRELGLVLLCFCGLLSVLAARRDDDRVALLAGVALGLTGVVSVPMLVNGVTWALVAVLVVSSRPWPLLGRILGLAAAVFALWAGPVALDYLRFDGFVNVAPILGREWPLPTALASWGLLGPLALAGLWLTAVRCRRAALPLLALAGAAIVMFAVALLRGALDWQLGGIPWLLHQGRMWPPAHLLASALAGLFLLHAFRWVRARRPVGAVVAVGAIFGIGVVSLVLASCALTETIARARGGFIYAGEDFREDGFVRKAAGRLGPRDVVEVHGSPALDLLLFQYSGVRVANFEDRRLESNDARIRYAELARRWDETVANGGFRADYVALPASRAPRGAEVVALGSYDDRSYVLIRAQSRARRGLEDAHMRKRTRRVRQHDLEDGPASRVRPSLVSKARPLDAVRVAARLEQELRAAGTPSRADGEKRYLKSDLRFHGATVPDVRRVIRSLVKQRGGLSHEEVVGLAEALWRRPVHERRMAAVMLLASHAALLEPGDLVMIERLLRESRTWAYVDALAGDVVGKLLITHPEIRAALDRWARDDDFWIRRSALLAHLKPLARGGDFHAFGRYADAMLEEKEFFIRKAIGWVLRETGKKRPHVVFEWLRPRAARASGVTMREAVKYLDDDQRATLLEAHRSGRQVTPGIRPDRSQP
jgi:3-methyladenine DNA glycosylase AlkD